MSLHCPPSICAISPRRGDDSRRCVSNTIRPDRSGIATCASLALPGAICGVVRSKVRCGFTAPPPESFASPPRISSTLSALRPSAAENVLMLPMALRSASELSFRISSIFFSVALADWVSVCPACADAAKVGGPARASRLISASTEPPTMDTTAEPIRPCVSMTIVVSARTGVVGSTATRARTSFGSAAERLT